MFSFIPFHALKNDLQGQDIQINADCIDVMCVVYRC